MKVRKTCYFILFLILIIIIEAVIGYDFISQEDSDKRRRKLYEHWI